MSAKNTGYLDKEKGHTYCCSQLKGSRRESDNELLLHRFFGDSEKYRQTVTHAVLGRALNCKIIDPSEADRSPAVFYSDSAVEIEQNLRCDPVAGISRSLKKRESVFWRSTWQISKRK